MRQSIPFLFLVISNVLLNISCKKNQDNQCESIKRPNGSFIIKELVGDTSFVADTVFRDNYVQFQSIDNYDGVLWKIGTDPRNWTSTDFSLSFYNSLGTIPITFKGSKAPNNICFPNDNGTYTSTKTLTVVEQLEKPNIILSPLIGKYRGYFTDNPSDTFTTRIEYFDSLKYDGAVTGSKNFYWLSNMPNGYISNLGWSYPELKNGQPIDMGYKCFQFGGSSDIIQGKGWLSHDSLYINYGNNLVGRKKFIGKKY